MPLSSKTIPLGLGLDAGGTSTRWALADAQGTLIAEGSAGGFSGTQMTRPEGVAEVAGVLADLRAQLSRHGQPGRVWAGVTGFDGDGPAPLAALVAQTFGVELAAVRLFNDIELACRAAFAPGEGYLVYAGTGSVAAFIDAKGVQHRAGGHGGLIDDGGSGYWISREALRHIWRTEDETPGAWQQSLLAQRVFEQIGGSDWGDTRNWVYGASRGQLGTLALAVAQAAGQGDAAALGILQGAGRELARLGQVLIRRHGPRPVMLAGRAWQLHPTMEASLRAELAGVEVRSPVDLQVHRRAAALAAAEIAA